MLKRRDVGWDAAICCCNMCGWRLFKICFLLCRVSADLGSFVGLGGDSPAGSGHMGNSSAGSLAPSPFKLPASYEEAKERKVAAVSDLRNAVKAVRSCSLSFHPAWHDMHARGLQGTRQYSRLDRNGVAIIIHEGRPPSVLGLNFNGSPEAGSLQCS